MALKACKTTFESSLSRRDKIVVISPAFTHGTLLSSEMKSQNYQKRGYSLTFSINKCCKIICMINYAKMTVFKIFWGMREHKNLGPSDNTKGEKKRIA